MLFLMYSRLNTVPGQKYVMKMAAANADYGLLLKIRTTIH